jgi:magnesium transporter
MRNVICYNDREVKEGQGSKDVKKGYNLWIDIVDPTASEIFNVELSFNLDNKAVETFLNKSKKPQIRVLEDHTFTIFLHMRYKNIENLDTEAVYFFLGSGWLITIHSYEIDLSNYPCLRLRSSIRDFIKFHGDHIPSNNLFPLNLYKIYSHRRRY